METISQIYYEYRRPESASPRRAVARKIVVVDERPPSVVVVVPTFRRLSEAFAFPGRPPTIPGLDFELPSISLTDIVDPPAPATKWTPPPQEQRPAPPRKAFHPNRRGPPALEGASRRALARDVVVAERVVRDAQDRLRRIAAETVRRAKDSAAIEERTRAEVYRSKRDTPRQIPDEKTRRRRRGDTPVACYPKPPVPRQMRRQRPPSAPPAEEEPHSNDDDDREEDDEIAALRVELPNGEWIDVDGPPSSTVRELKAMLSLLTMESGTKPLLASEFRLRDETSALDDENETLRAVVVARGTSFRIELNDLGRACFSSIMPDHSAAKKGVHDLSEAKPRRRRRAMIARRIKTPAECAKMTEDLRDANRFVKGERARMLAKAECSRHYRKIAELERKKKEEEEEKASPPPLIEPLFTPEGPNLKYYEAQFVPIPDRPARRGGRQDGGESRRRRELNTVIT